MEPRPLFDWHRFHARRNNASGWVDSRRRMRLGFGVVTMLLVVVLARVVQLEVTYGEQFREAAAKPLVRTRHIPGVRGRILARDGTVLAVDREVLALAVHYRYLEEPPDQRWLHDKAIGRISKSQRKQPQAVAAAKAQVLDERRRLATRLCQLAGLGKEQWEHRTRAIQARVERIAESVNHRRRETWSRQQGGRVDFAGAPADSFVEQLADWLAGLGDDRQPARAPHLINVAEELDYHIVAEEVPLEAVAEIQRRPDLYPGVRIVENRRRHYPHERLAAQLLGHLGPVEPGEIAASGDGGYRTDDRLGRAGIEAQYERLLRGQDGEAIEVRNRSGDLLSTYRQQEPGIGRDLVLTIDPRLQRTAESLLDEVLRRREVEHQFTEPAGGAAVVMSTRTGALLAAATSPRFNPNAFETREPDAIDAIFSDPGRPLFDRTARMAIPPGSVFKVLTALALLESGNLDPETPFFCQGYWARPDRMRCAIYARHGVGHGKLALRDAMAVSCNVYFFHHAAELGIDPLIDWAKRLGFGRRTGIDLPAEAEGNLPSPQTRSAAGRRWKNVDTQMLAIGQGELTATPLQIARLLAAVATGKLVTPHLAHAVGLPQWSDSPTSERSEADCLTSVASKPAQPIEGLRESTLPTLRRAVEAVVADPDGTAHGAVHLESLPLAGKTGTAQTGAGREDHAWFAGYFPAHRPQYVVVVAIEHAGSGATAAGPVAKRLALQMQRLGLVR